MSCCNCCQLLLVPLGSLNIDVARYPQFPTCPRSPPGSELPVLVLQVSIPLWALVHLPVVVTVTTAMFTPKGWLHCILYVLFENAMGIVKMGAVVAGECGPMASNHMCSILTVQCCP